MEEKKRKHKIIGGQTDEVSYRTDVQLLLKVKLEEERYYKQKRKTKTILHYICMYICTFCSLSYIHADNFFYSIDAH